MTKEVRTRFAPSPTGYLHVGGIRTALFAWLAARQAGGQFILRIEDTDKKRHVGGADKHIIECLKWLGLDYDEGPIYQSQRVDKGVYKKWGEKLIEAGRAYADPFSPDELAKLREKAKHDKKPFLFRDHRPSNPPRWDGKKPLRFKSEPKPYKFKDVVMGEIATGPEVVDDFILIKSDGFPTYNFAHVIDDIEMDISHVIRGQEFISSVPNYLNLHEALGQRPPAYATVPHILNAQGNKKLSKRDGAKDVLEYQQMGILPEAMASFLASLGWNDDTEREYYFRDYLLENFSLEQIHHGGAHFDERRLLWQNGVAIRETKPDDLFRRVGDYWPKSAVKHDDTYKKRVLGLVQERLKYFTELPELTTFFFEDLPVDPSLIENHKKLKKYDSSQLADYLNKARDSLEQSDFSTSDLTDRLNDLLEKTAEKPVVLFSLIRIATTQAPASPELAPTLHVIGKGTCLERIDRQIAQLT